MKKNIVENIPKAPVDPMAGVRAKVDEVLEKKISEVIAAYQVQRDQALSELSTLQQSLESAEEEMAELKTERGNLVKGIFGPGSRGVGGIDLKIFHLEDQVRGVQKQIDAIFSKLTELPKIDFALLNFLSRYEKP